MNPKIKIITKRLYHLAGILRFEIRRQRLCLAGAKIPFTCAVSSLELHGPVSRLTVGKFSSIGKAYIQLHEEVSVGANVIINDDVTILTGTHEVDCPEFTLISKGVQIDDYAWIAVGATLLPGVRVGRGSVVGTKAVVSKDVPSGAVVAGNPARIVRSDRNPSLRYRPSLMFAAYEAWLKEK